MQAAINVWEVARVGMRLTSSGAYGSMADSDRRATFGYAATLRPLFSRMIIAAGGFMRDSAERLLASGDADLVAFGRNFIANPDLVARLRHDWPLNRYDRTTFYGGDARGYTDYPFHDDRSAPGAAV